MRKTKVIRMFSTIKEIKNFGFKLYKYKKQRFDINLKHDRRITNGT